MPKIVDGNILNHEGLIVQQVNCQGVMGSGLAKQIRDKYPRNYEEYRTVCNEHNKDHDPSELLGKVLFVGVTPIQQLMPRVTIANLFGQDKYGRDKQHTDYDALRKGLSDINLIAKRRGLKVAIPYGIGCGLGGGDWEIVLQIIIETMTTADYTIYRYK